MKGLLIKDFYTLVKQLKFVLLFLIIMMVIPGINQSAFAMIYFAMMPITAMAYDERCKWDSLAAMMPYTAKDLVLSKYLLGYIGMGAACMLSLGANWIIKLFQHSSLTMEDALAILLIACAGMILLAVNLPFIFRFGVEKGRIVFMVIIATSVFALMMAGDKIKLLLASDLISPALLAGLGVGAAVLSNMISIAISNAVYKRKIL